MTASERKMESAVRKAIERAGGILALARALGIRHQSLGQWKRIPPVRVLAVERITGVSRHDLRPDIYPRER